MLVGVFADLWPKMSAHVDGDERPNQPCADREQEAPSTRSEMLKMFLYLSEYAEDAHWPNLVLLF